MTNEKSFDSRFKFLIELNFFARFKRVVIMCFFSDLVEKLGPENEVPLSPQWLLSKHGDKIGNRVNL